MQGRFTTLCGKAFPRYKLRAWPGRGGPIETTFKQELPGGRRRIHADYPDWKVAISDEIEQDFAKRRA